MKKKILLSASALLFFTTAAYSQIGINTPDPHATLEVSSEPGTSSKTDGFIAPKLKGSELKAKDALYGSHQEGTIVYITEMLSSGETTPKTRNVVNTGYYYFNGTVWMRFNDLGRAPLMVTAFNGSGAPVPGVIITEGVYQKLSFPKVNIGTDSSIGIWNSSGDEFTVVKKGVYTIATALRMENVIQFGSALLIIHGGTQIGSSGATASGSGAPLPLSSSFVMILEPGDKIWAEAVRNITDSKWELGNRSINITFSEIN
ncbi:hypothetical protein [Chryseobacterium vrystaatense]|uniref:C1q domain-containing protein n=1 Tax=Chryseobacterium vrystaatense TaxID=307480 RepID=A0ABR4UGL0_9FLAO|nr:hypothetical protein [Chryseobacterium vrystaatense]KFF23675.1 hypothetical protein IW16_25885 [Chryseobacterium vrystaatense]